MELIIIYILLGIGIIGFGFLFSMLFIYCIQKLVDNIYEIDEEDEEEENYYY